MQKYMKRAKVIMKKLIANKLKNIYYRRYNFINPKSKKKIIYIIRFYRREGLMSMLYKYLAHLEYCKKMNYIPYVDTSIFKTMYSTQKSKNIWNLFFNQQPIKHSIFSYQYIISDAGKGKEVIENAPLFGKMFVDNFNDFERKHDFFVDNVTINNMIMSEVDKFSKQYSVEDCLGLYLRGTDYVSLKPKGHFIQPYLEEIIPVVDNFINKYNPKKILLITEDKNYTDALQNIYKDKIIVPLPKNIITKYQQNKMLGNVIKNKLETANDYLIGGKTNGSLMATVLNGNRYKSTYLFDKGVY